MDTEYEKLKADFLTSAAMLPPGKEPRLRKGQSSLHDIIRTREQADRFMRELLWLQEESRRENQVK